MVIGTGTLAVTILSLGNGNWSFGSDNSTIGNGNWNFGQNNIIIGNGNWLFTDNNIIIGNGNWFVSDDSIASAASQNLATPESLVPLKSDVNSLISSLIGNFGTEFTMFTGDFDTATSQTFNQLILSKADGSSISNFSESDLTQIFAALSGMPATEGMAGNSGCFFGCSSVPTEPVPEPTSALPILAAGLVYFVWSKKSKAKANIN